MINENKATREEMKEQAIKMMELLLKHKPIIREFKTNNTVMFDEAPLWASYYVDGEDGLPEKIKEVETEYGGLVYHALHTLTDFGEMYELFYVSAEKETWEDDYEQAKNGYVFCYVWNRTDEWCSEFGTIAVRPTGAGTVRRVG